MVVGDWSELKIGRCNWIVCEDLSVRTRVIGELTPICAVRVTRDVVSGTIKEAFQ